MISILGAVYYLINENYTLAISLAIVGVTLPIIHSAGLAGAFFNGKKDFKTSAIAGIIMTTVVAAAVIVTAMFTHNPAILIFAYFLSTAAVSLSIYLWTLRTHKPCGSVDKNFVSFGKHLSLTSVLETVSEHLDKVLVFHYLGAAQLAVYTFALAIPNQMNAVAKGIKSITLPKLSEKDIGALRDGIKAKTLRLFFIFLSITITYIIGAPYIYQLLFPQYMESVLYSQIFITLLVSSMLIAQMFVAHGKMKEIYINKISSDALKIIYFSRFSFSVFGGCLCHYSIDCLSTYGIFFTEECSPLKLSGKVITLFSASFFLIGISVSSTPSLHHRGHLHTSAYRGRGG